MAEFAQVAEGRRTALHAAIERPLAAGLHLAADWAPVHWMELGYRLGQIGLGGYLPPLGDLYAGTVLARQLPLPVATNSDLYRITHTVMYLTDMGHRSVEDVLGAGGPDQTRREARARRESRTRPTGSRPCWP